MCIRIQLVEQDCKLVWRKGTRGHALENTSSKLVIFNLILTKTQILDKRSNTLTKSKEDYGNSIFVG